MMEIDMQIRNATREEVQQMFSQQVATVITTGPDVAGPVKILKKVPGTSPEKKKGGDQDAPSWTDEEHKALDENIGNFEAAYKAYKKVAPHSTRTRSAVRQRWVIRARRKKNGGKIQKKPKTVVKRIDETLTPGSQQPGPQDPPDKIPIATGMHVRQIKAEKGEKILGEAIVLKVDGDQVKVRNGPKKARIISASCLEVIPIKEIKDKKTKTTPAKTPTAANERENVLTPAEEPILTEEDQEPDNDEVNHQDSADSDPDVEKSSQGDVTEREPNFKEVIQNTANPSHEPIPAPPRGMTRGQLVRHDGAKSDPHYGQTGTIERIPQHLSECLVRFKLSSSWVKKTDLVPVEGSS